MQNLLTILAVASCAIILAGCTVSDRPAGADMTEDEFRGREQLVRAFDAGWIRFVAAGKDNEVLKTEPPNRPGAAAGYMVKMADCLPVPELAPFPQEPVGLFRRILDTGKIRMLTQTTVNTPDNTAYYFTGVSEKYLQGVLDEIAAHYGVALEIENVTVGPGRFASTSYLLNGEADFVGQLNATGGATQGMRRRLSRRFTCTMSASAQFIHMPEQAAVTKEINTWYELTNRPDVRICAGPLSSQTARTFLPGNQVKTIYINDIAGCVKQIKQGEADAIISPLPDLKIAGVVGYRSLPTMIVAGTPLWVALEGIECPVDGDAKTADSCFEVSPP